MKFKNLIYIAVAGILPLASCSDFLDKLPDNRIDESEVTPLQLSRMLAGNYSDADVTLMCELSADNIIDNHAPNAAGITYENLGAFDPIDDQLFAWEDADLYSMQDSPTYVWTFMYKSIAAANHVLEMIENIRAEGKYSTGEDAERIEAVEGEALIMRAYYHFMLVNMFGMQYRGDELSKNDMGIPYVTEPEKEVFVNYEREPVSTVYQKIEEDLIAGMGKINDSFYEQPKYHFNKNAVYAFAARFYLFKRDYKKVNTYATNVLGEDPSGMLRSDYWAQSFSNLDAANQQYYSATAVNNFFLAPTMSMTFMHLCIGNGGSRYAVNGEGMYGSIYGSGPTWNGANVLYNGRLYVNTKQEYGLWPQWRFPFMEYLDKVAGTGYYHQIRDEFTAEQLLLERAEARIYLNDIPGAVRDLKCWDQSRQHSVDPEMYGTLSEALIENFYNRANVTDKEYDSRRYNNLADLNIDDICPRPEYRVTEKNRPYLWCVLHFRRMETLFSGTRWFDIKRYGIEITHKIGRSRVETLTPLDPRRAFQVPIEALSAGLEPTPRSATPDQIKSVRSVEKAADPVYVPFYKSVLIK